MIEQETNIGLVKLIDREKNRIDGSGFTHPETGEVVTAWHVIQAQTVAEDAAGEQKNYSFIQVGDDLAFSIGSHEENGGHENGNGIPIAETLGSYGNAEVIGYDPKTGEVFKREVIYFRTDEDMEIGVICSGENPWTLSRGMSGSIVIVDAVVLALTATPIQSLRDAQSFCLGLSLLNETIAALW